MQQWRNYSLTSRDMDYASRDRQASRGASSESRASNQLLPLGIIQVITSAVIWALMGFYVLLCGCMEFQVIISSTG